MTQDEMRRGQAMWESNRRILMWLTLGLSELFLSDEDHDKYETERVLEQGWIQWRWVAPARNPYGNPLKRDEKR